MDNTLRRLRLVGQQSQLRKLWQNAAHLFRVYNPFHFVCQYIYFLGFDSKNNQFPGLVKKNSRFTIYDNCFSKNSTIYDTCFSKNNTIYDNLQRIWLFIRIHLFTELVQKKYCVHARHLSFLISYMPFDFSRNGPIFWYGWKNNDGLDWSFRIKIILRYEYY